MTTKQLESEIRASIIMDLLKKTDWDVKAIAHVVGHRKASRKELKKALEIKTSKKRFLGL